jgi:UDP-glucose 4-epimerase
MDLQGKQLTVTGGAGLVGSHLAHRLVADNEVLVVDDCSNGSSERVPGGATFLEGDLTDPSVVADAISPETDAVIHCAAAKDVNADRPRAQFEDNGTMTYNVLERMDEVGVDRLVYTSSSTVYGEAPRPTPEDYAPLEPISPYGASKLAEEGLISTYAHSHGIRSWVFRFANILGPGMRIGVVPDFIRKLRDSPDRLVILGNGRQEKSYLHVEGCVAAISHVVEHADDAMNIYNLGTRTTTSVDRIADIVSDVLGLDPACEYTGGERGWTGDVPRMRLSVEKLAALGWEPEGSSDDAVRRAAEELSAEL